MYALKQRVHPTWLFTVLCAGFLLGVGLARYVGPIHEVYFYASLVGSLLVFWRRQAWVFGMVLVAGLVMGLWRGGIEVGHLAETGQLYGKTHVVIGQIADDPEQKNGVQVVQLTNLRVAERQLAGTFYVTSRDNIALRREDLITVKGLVGEGFGSNIAKIYNAQILRLERPKNMLLDLRDAFARAVRQVLPEPLSSLGLGILVGQKTELPSDFSEALKIAGLTHIVVASGYNLTILVRLARRLFEKLSRYQAALWSVAMILGFMAITGWSASMTRAGLVAGLSLWAWYYGRKFHPVTLLLFAAAVTVIVQPNYLWGNIGWALSFAAFAGVLILAPLLHAYFYGKQKPGFMAQTLLETLSAQLVTLPIMMGVFGQLSVVALLSNLMILPLVPLGMLLTFCAGLTQLLVPALGVAVAWPAQFLLGYFVWAVNWTAGFPWAQIKWQMPAWLVIVSFLTAIGLCLYLKYKTRYSLRQANLVE